MESITKLAMDKPGVDWDLYGISLTDLMAWNCLNASSIIYPGQLLFGRHSPPLTPTMAPPTETPLPTHIYPQPFANDQPLSPTPSKQKAPLAWPNPTNWLWLLAAAAVGVAVYVKTMIVYTLFEVIVYTFYRSNRFPSILGSPWIK